MMIGMFLLEFIQLAIVHWLLLEDLFKQDIIIGYLYVHSSGPYQHQNILGQRIGAAGMTCASAYPLWIIWDSSIVVRFIPRLLDSKAVC
jgi:hypothetical protein